MQNGACSSWLPLAAAFLALAPAALADTIDETAKALGAKRVAGDLFSTAMRIASMHGLFGFCLSDLLSPVTTAESSANLKTEGGTPWCDLS